MTQKRFVECPFYPNPKTDNQRLLNLQKEYKATGNDKALLKMYELMQVIALKMIRKIAEKNVNVQKLAESEKIKKSHDASTYIIEQYIRRPDFVIEKSVTGYLYRRVLKELYYIRKIDKMSVSIDDYQKGNKKQ